MFGFSHQVRRPYTGSVKGISLKAKPNGLYSVVSKPEIQIRLLPDSPEWQLAVGSFLKMSPCWASDCNGLQGRVTQIRKVTHVAFIIQSPAWAPVLRKYYFLFLVLQTMQLNTNLPYFKNMAFLVMKMSLKVSLWFFLLASSVLSQPEAFGEK